MLLMQMNDMSELTDCLSSGFRRKMRVKEILRTATQAWSPAAKHPAYLALGKPACVSARVLVLFKTHLLHRLSRTCRDGSAAAGRVLQHQRRSGDLWDWFRWYVHGHEAPRNAAHLQQVSDSGHVHWVWNIIQYCCHVMTNTAHHSKSLFLHLFDRKCYTIVKYY